MLICIDMCVVLMWMLGCGGSAPLILYCCIVHRNELSVSLFSLTVRPTE